MANAKPVVPSPAPAKPATPAGPTAKKFPVGIVLAVGAVGVGAYLLWRQLRTPSVAPTIAPGGLLPTPGPTSTATVPPGTMPSAYPIATSGPAISSPEAYLEAIGKPAPGATVTGPLPPAGMFPAFKGSAGPKQKACLAAGGTWTGPAGKKFCVKPA